MVLVEPEIAANTGSIGRTCVAAGAMLWLVRPLGFHLDDRHLRRAGLDYWEHLICASSNSPGRGRAGAAARPALVLQHQGEAVLYRRRICPRRRAGLRPREPRPSRTLLSEAPDRALRIPIRPEARSLNLANAVAIAVFEAVRQIDKAMALQQTTAAAKRES